MAMAKKLYVYYQPNVKDIKDTFGDCTVRALSKALNCTWLEAFDKMIPFCREYQVSNIFDCNIANRKAILNELGFDYCGISVRNGSSRPTVAEFAKQHKHGTFILNVACHVVACVDGQYFDTWDSGHKSLYGYFVLREG